MRIDNQDIIRTAHQLRDEENSGLHVRSWNRHHRRFNIPAWLTTIPAAAIVGFVLGIWTKDYMQSSVPLTALVDTVYIIKGSPTEIDTSQFVRSSQELLSDPQPVPVVSSANTVKHAQWHRAVCTGKPMKDDKIRYDLLVTN